MRFAPSIVESLQLISYSESSNIQHICGCNQSGGGKINQCGSGLDYPETGPHSLTSFQEPSFRNSSLKDLLLPRGNISITVAIRSQPARSNARSDGMFDRQMRAYT
jgi:hypothetical protein